MDCYQSSSSKEQMQGLKMGDDGSELQRRGIPEFAEKCDITKWHQQPPTTPFL